MSRTTCRHGPAGRENVVRRLGLGKRGVWWGWSAGFVGAAETLDRHLTGSALLLRQAALALDIVVGALTLARLVAFLFPLWSAHRWLTTARPSSGSDCSAPSLPHPATSHGRVHSRRLQLVREDRRWEDRCP